MANCPDCGGMLHYDIKKRKVICTYCSSEYQPKDLDVNSAVESDSMGVRFFTCPNCGGEIFSTDKDLTGKCSFCGSPVTFESRMEETRRPDYIIPFEKTKEDCRDNYIETVKKSFFVRKDLGKEENVKEFRGIYMPYWIKTIRHKGEARAYLPETTERKDYQVQDMNRLIYQMDVEYEDLNHDASAAFSDDISERVEPFELQREGESTLEPFYPAYLTGFYAEPKDVEEEVYGDYFNKMAIENTDKLIGTQEVRDYTTTQEDSLISFYDSLEPLDKRALNSQITQMIRRDKELEQESKHKLKKLLKQEEEERNKEEKEFQEQTTAYTKEAKKLKKGADSKTGGSRYGYQIEEEPAKLALFPLWFLSYRKGDRVNYIAMNGQTGRVCADLPIDLKKVFAVAGIISLVLFFLIDRFTFLPYQVCTLTIWMGAVLLMMLKDEQAVITEHEEKITLHKERGNITSSAANVGAIALVVYAIVFVSYKFICIFEKDATIVTNKGPMIFLGAIGTALAAYVLFGALKTGENEPAIRKTPMYFLVFASVLFNMAVLVINPVSDYLFYAAASVGLICIPLSMIYMITRFNLVTSRPLPQFEHKGVDDNE